MSKSYKFCPVCFKTFNIWETDSLNSCPSNDHHTELIEVDEEFLYIIAELNRKGYTTRYCCSGHIDEWSDMCDMYIYFNGNFTDKVNIPREFKVFHNKVHEENDNAITIRYKKRGIKTRRELLENYYKGRLLFNDFVENLPDNRNEYGEISNEYFIEC